MMLTVSDIFQDAPETKIIELRRKDGGELPAFRAGDHIVLNLPNGMKRSYSLANDPSERHRYVLGVHLSPNSRGGSAMIHTGLRVGQDIQLDGPVSGFPLIQGGQNYLLVAGGIGITPILSMAFVLARRGARFSLHYATRSPTDAVFDTVLASEPLLPHVKRYSGTGEERLNLAELIAGAPSGSHIYCCGPARMIDEATRLAKGRRDVSLTTERFQADASVASENRPFTCRIASTNQTVSVAADVTILQALRDIGLDIDSICEAGTCGTCILNVLEGTVDHRDECLLPEERETRIAVCVSRARSDCLVLDL